MSAADDTAVNPIDETFEEELIRLVEAAYHAQPQTLPADFFDVPGPEVQSAGQPEGVVTQTNHGPVSPVAVPALDQPQHAAPTIDNDLLAPADLPPPDVQPPLPTHHNNFPQQPVHLPHPPHNNTLPQQSVHLPPPPHQQRPAMPIPRPLPGGLEVYVHPDGTLLGAAHQRCAIPNCDWFGIKRNRDSAMITNYSSSAPPLTNLHPARPLPYLPPELLSHIFTLVSSPSTFLTLTLVSHRFHALASNCLTRRRFASTWFRTYCNNLHTPRILHYLARYVRLHTILGDGLAHCKTTYPVSKEAIFSRTIYQPGRGWVHRKTGKIWPFNWRFFQFPFAPGGTGWRHFAFAEMQEAMEDGGNWGGRMARVVGEVDRQMRRLEVPEGGWRMENVEGAMVVEDCVFVLLVRGLMEDWMGRPAREWGPGDEEYWEVQMGWLGRMMLMRQTWGCECRVTEVRAEGWTFGERDLKYWRDGLEGGIGDKEVLPGPAAVLGVDMVPDDPEDFDNVIWAASYD
ncbi:hypothetical protein BJ508DRAFT_334546 [Ascobolus immersus RN42]|uniref:F-box domain-containing protein n=1 Tax=Ascobolus immersus RN42 TaxID=1160509 RepID=A0A3N4HK62_ASCIM|nr:hypothetical protein BJ508DRAFT_334546 [Ascobolus immersus RN42]